MKGYFCGRLLVMTCAIWDYVFLPAQALGSTKDRNGVLLRTDHGSGNGIAEVVKTTVDARGVQVMRRIAESSDQDPLDPTVPDTGSAFTAPNISAADADKNTAIDDGTGGSTDEATGADPLAPKASGTPTGEDRIDSSPNGTTGNNSMPTNPDGSVGSPNDTNSSGIGANGNGTNTTGSDTVPSVVANGPDQTNAPTDAPTDAPTAAP